MKTMTVHLKAFLQGVVQFRHAFTPHFKNFHHKLAYDRGRELAHRLTLRRYED